VVMIVFSGSLATGSVVWGQVARHIGMFACFTLAGLLLLVLAAATALTRPGAGRSPAEQR